MHNLKNTYSLSGSRSSRWRMRRGVKLGSVALMKVMLVVMLFGVILSGNAYAKGGDILLQKSDAQAHRQQAAASATDSAGNVFVAGFRNLTNTTDDDYWTVKFDTAGNVVWRTAYNKNFGSDQATSLAIDSNNDVIVTGYIWNGSNNDIYTVKYNGATGIMIWENTYSNPANGNDVGSAIAFDSSQNVVYVGGYSQNAQGNQDYLILKYSNSTTGNNPPQNIVTLGGTAGGNDRISALSANADGLAATGASWNGTDFDLLTVMFEPSGVVRWQKRYSSNGSYPETGRVVKFDSAGNVVMAATVSNPLDFDIYLVKYAKSDGSVIWQQTYNGGYDDEPMGLVVAGDGDVYLTGYTWTLAGSNDFYTARHNATTGNLVWRQVYNSSYDNSDIATATGIVVDDSPNGDVYVTGYTVASGNYDFRTLKYKKENGHLLWQQSFNGPQNLSDRTVGIALAPGNGLYVTGWSDNTAAIPGETSTATGGSTNTIQNLGKNWSANQWAGYHVMVTSGANSGIVRKIASNSSTAIVISPDFGAVMAPGDGYYIFDKDNYDLQLIKYDRGDLNPPTGLTSLATVKAADGTYTIRLNWEDNSPDETGFIIERKLGELGVWGEIYRTGANATTYDNSGLSANQYYYYRVKSYKDSTESYPSNETHSLTFLISYITPIWQLSYNGGQNMEDYATSIAVGPDDNPVVTGRSDSGLIGMFDFYTLKLNRATGGIIWQDRYDSMQNEMDNAVCLNVDNNNDVVVSGFSSLFYAPTGGNVHSVFTMKYPSAGPPALWERQYNGPAGIDDRATAIASTTDGSNTFVVGYGRNVRFDNDIYLVKYYADGTEAWHISPIDGGRNDYPSGIALDPQGNVVITGYRQGSRGVVTDFDNFDFYTAKFNSAGVKQWEDSYNPYPTGDSRALGVTTDSSGDVYITGYVTNPGDQNTPKNKDFYTIKYSGSSGSRVWERSYNGPANGDDWAIGIKADPIIGKNPLDSNIVVVGTRTTDATVNDTDIHVIRYSQDGELRWERTLLRPNETETAEAVSMDSSGYIYIAGDTGGDTDKNIISVIYDYEGTLLGGTTYNGGYGYDQASSIAVNHQGEAFIAGYTTNAAQNADYIVIKQKNTYKLVPTPFTAAPQADYSKIALSWRDNSPGTRFRIEKTPGPATVDSVWDFLVDINPGITSYTVTGLSANTQYCYKIEAYEGTLPSRKVIVCGTTTLPAPVLNPASTISTTSATISWPNVSGNTGYKLERKTGAAGTWALAPNGNLAANAVSYNDTALTSGTQYFYRISANSPNGYSIASSELTVWTLPSATVLNALSVVSATRIDLSWSNVTGETGYRIERKSGAAGTWTTLTTKPVDTISHSDTTVLQNSEYFYRVFAYNSSGDSASSTEQRAVTLSSTSVTVTTISKDDPVNQPGSLRITWNDLPDETGYIVQESLCNSYYPANNPTACSTYLTNDGYWYGWTQVGAVLPPGTTTYVRSGLAVGTAYRYRIIANVPVSNNAALSNTTAQGNLKGAWTTLQTPTTLAVNPVSDTSLNFTWNDITGETSFNVERKTGAAGTWGAPISKTLNTITHTDTGLALQTEYCYRVTPVSNAGSADFLLPTGILPSAEKCLPTPLPAPVLNPLVLSTATEVTVSWTNVPGNSGYELQRCNLSNHDYPNWVAPYLNNDGYWNSCTTLTIGTDVTSYIDSGRTAGYSYRYKIRDKYGSQPYYSAWSANLGTTMKPPTPSISSITANSTTQLTVNWGQVYGELEYRLEWKPRSGADCTAGTWNTYLTAGMNVTSYAHSGLTAGTYYCYRVSAANGTLVSDPSAAVSQTTFVGAPVLNVPSNVTISSAQLVWSNVSGNTGYRISRKIEPTGTYAVLTSLGKDITTYTATGLSAGTLYGFMVEAQNPAGYSVSSNEQTTVTTPAKPTLNPMALSSAQVELSWLQMKGSSNYKLERRPSGGTWSQLSNLSIPYVESYCGYAAPRVSCPSLSQSSSTYLDQGLGGGANYCYQLKAWNATGGDSVPSAELCVGTSEIVAPILAATAVNSLKVGLSWSYTPGSCAAGPCEAPTGYLLEKQAAGGVWQPIVQANATTTSYTDVVGIDPKKTYNYRSLAYAGTIDTFERGIVAGNWSQQGINRNNSGTVVANVTKPPVNIVDQTNGNISISANGGGVLITTASPGGGLANSYNNARLNLLSPSVAHGNFDVRVEYRIPEVLSTPAQYHVYGRLHMDLPAGVGANYVYVERSTGAYVAYITVNDVQFYASLPTSDLAGKLRVTRHGDRITAYAWTGGKWQVITEKAGASTGSATGINFSQYAQRNEAVSIKLMIDNFEALSNKSAYSPVVTVTTPGYATIDGSCPQ